MKKVLFRVDSSSKIGLGHMMRCLTLAKRLANNGLEIFFASQDLVGNINSKIEESDFSLKILQEDTPESVIELIKDLNIYLLVIDSYKIDFEYEKKIYDFDICKILAFDDLLIPHCSNIVLNHGLQIDKSHYKDILTDKTKLFCGSETTILRDEFFQSHNTSIEENSVALLLGGNDALNVVPKIIDILKEIGDFNISVITSSTNQNLKQIRKREIELKLDIDNIAEVLSNKELIICATSTVLFEVMALKKRFINIKVASNQNSIVEFLEGKDINTTLDINELSERNLRQKIKYISKCSIYDKLDLNFSKTKLVEKIVKELE